ncbi:hypothetical protein WJX73_001763 [Symbiochloris irregularis]|uniref:RRM domain-containing protein n=1 Tax=Symbiochloris irregularis TaxID=706552 RepID=A0AAW1PL96_9CHLO
MAHPELWQADQVSNDAVRYSAEDCAGPTQFLATRRKAGRYRIHVNVGFRLSEQQLRDYFSQFGPLTDVYLPKHRSGRVKGFGFCTFESEADLNKALQISDHVVVGVLVRINRAGPRPEFISVSKLERARTSRQSASVFSHSSTRAAQEFEPQGLPTGNRRLSLDSNVSSRGRFSDAPTGTTDLVGRDAGGVLGQPVSARRRSFDTRLLGPGYENTLLQQDQTGFFADARPLRADASWTPNLQQQQQQAEMQLPTAGAQQSPSSNLLYQLSVQSSWYG